MMDWKMVVDTILANQGLWLFAASGGVSLLFKWIATTWLPLYVCLSAISMDVPKFLYGCRMMFNKSLPWPRPDMPARAVSEK